MMTRSQTRIAELEARIAELEKENAKLKKETKEIEAVKELYKKTLELYKKDEDSEDSEDEDSYDEASYNEDSEDEDTDKDTEMTPEELQIDFWDNMGKMWGYDIIGSESHPLKKAFELYCEMKKEKMPFRVAEMSPEELQIDFWNKKGKMWGYDIIRSESHPLKKAFELYCEMKKEKM
jgi:predicted RNase H-like nuclease (RuvC/YqgF family)